jgi:hypothetical protein
MANNGGKQLFLGCLLSFLLLFHSTHTLSFFNGKNSAQSAIPFVPSYPGNL